MNAMIGAGPEHAWIMYYMAMPCPKCEELLPFEPNSEFRRDKVAAMNGLLEKFEGMPESESVLVVRALAVELITMTETVLPAESLREFEEETTDRIKEAGDLISKSSREFEILQEMMRIAIADVGDEIGKSGLPAEPHQFQRGPVKKGKTGR